MKRRRWAASIRRGGHSLLGFLMVGAWPSSRFASFGQRAGSGFLPFLGAVVGLSVLADCS